MIKVWADGAEAGLLDRERDRGSTFAYLPATLPTRAVSVTMPVRLSSWNFARGLAPVFEMNLPEGILRERLRLAFAKATGTFDDFDLLAIVGRSQLGRLRYTGEREQLNEEVPFQSVEEIIARGGGAGLLRHLMQKFATFSGVSGVQPKVLVRDAEASASLSGNASRISASYRGATHIVKFWDENEFPQLAANEYFCLKAAERAGLEVPRFRLAEDGTALVIDRFDLRPDGTYRGFEDFCVLNARTTADKYYGSYETQIMKRFQQFSGDSAEMLLDEERLFGLIVLNCVLRNGDAHLKNFGIVYEHALQNARLAPVYDLVTTAVYVEGDTMSLTLNGTTAWPDGKALKRLGETRIPASPARVRQILDRVSDAVAGTRKELRAYIHQHPEFRSIGESMLQHWEAGLNSCSR